MFGPKRKAGEYTFKQIDPPITQQKYDTFVRELEYLKKIARPRASEDVMELAHGGDFSENAGYQAAKGKLRSINYKIDELKERIKKAKIIKITQEIDTVRLGNKVTLNINNTQHTYTLLGSTETDPEKGIISNNSPIGSAIMGKRIGDIVHVKINNKIVKCYIVKIA